MKFCAICTDESDDLARSEDGFLECVRCRYEHPRSGRYHFETVETGLIQGASGGFSGGSGLNPEGFKPKSRVVRR